MFGVVVDLFPLHFEARSSHPSKTATSGAASLVILFIKEVKIAQRWVSALFVHALESIF